MAYARSKKHYRAVQAQHTCEKGLFIPENKKPKLLAIIAVGALAIFIKGFLLGLLAGRD